MSIKEEQDMILARDIEKRVTSNLAHCESGHRDFMSDITEKLVSEIKSMNGNKHVNIGRGFRPFSMDHMAFIEERKCQSS